jgi:hypothetical protein
VLQLSDGADAAGHRDRVRNSRRIPAMGLIASMPMDDWPARHAEVDIGWAGVHSRPLHRSAWRRRRQHRARRARQRWDAHAETPS